MRRFVPSAVTPALALLAPAMAAAAITVPKGVGISTAARGIPAATNLAVDSAGGLWVTSGAGGARPSDGVWRVAADGSAKHVATGLHTALGLAWMGGTLYVASVRTPSLGQVTALSGFDGKTFARRRTLLSNLPIGRHTVDSIAPGPDGRLYLGVGSEFDNRASKRKLAGTVVSFRPDGHGLRVEATGLRNPYGLAFVPGSDRLLVTENARDDLGISRPPDFLDLLPTAGAAPDFGFPRCYGQGGAACTRARKPLARFAPHASSDGIGIAQHWGSDGLSAFVAENGSGFPANPTGSDVVQIRLRRSSTGAITAKRPTVFARGFAPHDPLGATVGPDGAST